jgi:pimeloyl-ACP methyl ester carboxylesterase
MTSTAPGGPHGMDVTFVLIPGAGGQAWYWHRLVAELERRGRSAVAVDLPAADDDAGLADYVDAAVAAVGDRPAPVVVAQSIGGLVAPIVCTRVPARLLVLVNAMVPRPRETGGQWWEATGQGAARAELAAREGRPAEPFDPLVDFFHDVPTEVVAEALRRGEPGQSGRPFADVWPLDRWPDVPTRVLAGADDRFFPLPFQRRVARERLGCEVDVIPGGHLVALSRPRELADRLGAYVAELS